MRRRLAAVVLSVAVAACTSIGPGTVPHDRIDYATSIGNSWKEQTLLNIVKLRYADMPIFLEVAQVIAGYQLQSALSGSFTLGNFTASLIDRLTAAGTATAGSTYTDRPTVVYQPLTGVDFLKRLMTPIPPSSVLFMLQSGYFADRIMPIMVDSINGLNNESNRLRRPADPNFTRLVELMREGQLAGAIQIRIERPKDGSESSVLIFGPSKDPQLAARGRELKSLLGIKPDLRELRVNYGGYSGKDDEIDMMTRSMLQIMLEFATVVQVPEADVAQGKAGPGLVDTQGAGALSGPPLRVLVTDTPPQNAYVAVQYDTRWFWIAGTDIQSKYTFAIIMLLFSIADTGLKGAAPVVTIPANQ
jgi:predicted small lipoprotein YifL